MPEDSFRVLFLLHNDFEELEAVAPIDILRRAGCIVDVATTSATLHVNGRNGISIVAEMELADAKALSTYNALVIPGGPGIKKLRKNSEVLNLIKFFATNNKPLGAICAAPLLLQDAGVLNDVTKVAAHCSVKDEIPAYLGDRPFVEDRKVFTSRGAGDAIKFGLGLAARFVGREQAVRVAKDICLAETDVP